MRCGIKLKRVEPKEEIPDHIKRIKRYNNVFLTQKFFSRGFPNRFNQIIYTYDPLGSDWYRALNGIGIESERVERIKVINNMLNVNWIKEKGRCIILIDLFNWYVNELLPKDDEFLTSTYIAQHYPKQYRMINGIMVQGRNRVYSFYKVMGMNERRLWDIKVWEKILKYRKTKAGKRLVEEFKRRGIDKLSSYQLTKSNFRKEYPELFRFIMNHFQNYRVGLLVGGIPRSKVKTAIELEVKMEDFNPDPTTYTLDRLKLNYRRKEEFIQLFSKLLNLSYEETQALKRLVYDDRIQIRIQKDDWVGEAPDPSELEV